jgi:hypothetical protein
MTSKAMPPSPLSLELGALPNQCLEVSNNMKRGRWGGFTCYSCDHCGCDCFVYFLKIVVTIQIVAI